MHYVDHNGKALYFPKKWSKEAIAKNWRDIAFVEQNEHSPHLYRDKEIEHYKNGIVIELGAAEGSFSLEMADSAKELWIFECDKNWRAPLKATFAQYKNVHIVPKLVGAKNGGRYCTVDKVLGKRAKDVTLIKMDIEGFECEALKGAKRVISEAKRLAILCCAYHKEGDEERIRDLLGNDFEVTARDGYMLFYYDKKLAAPYFRHGVLKCIKKE